ncbi:NEDD4 family-interacting protein 2 [Holothuria leucospilota]|uniref:NEDD4 family-interacting protein 2 n=1 Tax=Holothuria leucospilota TaxID=206669 RepID=A0A9Q1BKJ2_HOLLE|nr:NEDD4 family-interacting protein 2 [Holothuria leucospilota]
MASPPPYTQLVEDQNVEAPLQQVRLALVVPEDETMPTTHQTPQTVAFIFNWIGFLFAYCLSITVAGRYGALAGFGASMVKWSLIAMYSDCCTPYMQSAVCLLAALIFCGILIFFRGIFLYMKAKAYFYSGRNGNIRFVYWRPE